MKFVMSLIWVILILTSCGLKYTPSETLENREDLRKKEVERYIQSAYKDSAVTYQSVLFAEPTVIKPYQFRVLDSLYELKYQNELKGHFDKSLETKINNQKMIVANEKEKIQFIEHHIYAIQKEKQSTVFAADITFDNDNAVSQFKITNQHQFASRLIPIYKAFLTGESLIYPNYLATKEEQDLYTLFETEFNQQDAFHRNTFLEHLLTVFELIRTTRSIETKSILQQLSVLASDKRNFSSQQDIVRSTNGVWEGEKLVGYEQEFTTPTGTYLAVYSPFFQLTNLTKKN